MLKCKKFYKANSTGTFDERKHRIETIEIRYI